MQISPPEVLGSAGLGCELSPEMRLKVKYDLDTRSQDFAGPGSRP